ncbi:hypothetical protein PAEPH01_2177 [Pancytospora epiphaga]|nr:hypothetical protein PAEPH01_2177 [Pancytospora epiphaga]
MKAVIDSGYFIDCCIPQEQITEGFIPQSVRDELKDKLTDEYYNLYSFKITIQNPNEMYVEEVKKAIASKHLLLSDADIDVVALMLELSDNEDSKWISAENIGETSTLCCLTKDNGIKQALLIFGLYGDPEFCNRRFKLRCFSCFALFDDEVDFCKKCGHNTITRVTIVGEGDNERILFSKNFRFKPRILKNSKGEVISSGDTRKYEQYKEKQGGRLKGYKVERFK